MNDENAVVGWWTIDGNGMVAEGHFATKADAEDVLREGIATGDYEDDYTVAYGLLVGDHRIRRSPPPN